jgi:hypothetical protein
LYRRFHRQTLASQIDSYENVMKPALGIEDAVFAKDSVTRHKQRPPLPTGPALIIPAARLDIMSF